MKITTPGLYLDLDEDIYRAQHDWLSVSGAKKLLPPSCPAKFKASLGVDDHRPQFDLGKAFHAEVLGTGAQVVEVDSDSWRPREARDARDEAYAAGNVPLLTADALIVNAMAYAVRNHDTASRLFVGGAPEVSAFWVDETTGVKCKARFDYLPDKHDGRRLIVPDLKSAISADPREFSKAAARYGYVIQQEHYASGLRHLGIDDDPAFVFVVVEKDAPYLVNVVQFADQADRLITSIALEKALRLFRECTETDTWPGWPGVTNLTLPTWHVFELQEMTE